MPVRFFQGLWRDAEYRRLWGAVVVSTYGSLLRGSAMVYVAIFVLHASPWAIGALRVAEMLPAFLVGLIAGAWVDRVRRRPVMIATDLIRAVVLFTVPLAAVFGLLGIGHLLVVAALVSICSVFFDVAYEAYLPSLVENERLVEANSKISAGASVVEAVSFSTGGWLVQILSAPLTIAIDAVTFLASALLVGRIRAPEDAPAPPGEDGHPSLLREIVEGLHTVWQQPVLRGLIATGALLSCSYGLVGTAILYYLNQEVGFDPGVLGMIFAVGGGAAFAGALLAQRISRLGVGVVMIGSLLLTAVGQAFVPLATGVNLVAIGLLIGQQLATDAALTIYEISEVSLRQAITPDHLLGRVNSCARVANFGANLLGIAIASYLGETIGLRAGLWLSVALTLLAAIVLAASPVRQVRVIPETPLEMSA